MAKALTTTSVDRLKSNPQRRIEVPDGLLPGLYLVIQPSGARSWAVRYRASGRTRKLTLGGYPALELGDARTAARLALVAASKGNDPAGEKNHRREASDTAVLSVARTYLARDAIANRTWKETARLLGLRPSEPADRQKPMRFVAAPGGIVASWSHRDIADIRRADVLAEIDQIVDRGAGISANRTLSALRRLFTWSIERGLITTSPAAGVPAPARETSRDRVLTDQELRWLWDAAGVLGHPFGTITKLLILTGQRRSEVAGMSREELLSDRWVIPAARAKNNQRHEVPLVGEAKVVLAEVPSQAEDLLFTTTGSTPVSGWSRAKARLDTAMAEAARGELGADAEIPPWTLHDIRRTAASGMARLGAPVHVVEKHLNHRTGTIRGVAAIYNRHDYWSERVDAASLWNDRVRLLVTD